MKKIYRPLIKGTNWALAGLLGFLGFSGCSEIEGGAAEYGVPRADYIIKGTVVAKETGHPIPGIEVKALSDYSDTKRTITNANGEYELPQLNDMSSIVATDIDGEANGIFKPDTILTDRRDMIQIGKGDGRWYGGKFTATVEFELEAEKIDE